MNEAKNMMSSRNNLDSKELTYWAPLTEMD